MSIFDPLLGRLKKDDLRERERRARPPFVDQVLATQGTLGVVPKALPAFFHKNPIVYRCVRMIAEACASVPFLLVDENGPCREHPLMGLLACPNPACGGADMRDMLVGHLLLHGNAYVEMVGQETVEALYVLPPTHMRLVRDATGWPSHYEYAGGGKIHRYDAGPISSIIHLKLHDPADPHYGCAPLNAASLPIAIHNAAGLWNKALFDNAARPSGALVYRGRDGQRLTDEQFDRLKEELKENFQGARNAGRPLLLEGGLDWASISMSPQDMDFIAAKHSAARDIALAFGVPPMLLGIPGDNSYANYAEANRAFWRQTIIPLNGRISAAFGAALCRETNLVLQQDLEHVTALAEERRALWRRINDVDFLTQNEKRRLAGFPDMETLTDEAKGGCI